MRKLLSNEEWASQMAMTGRLFEPEFLANTAVTASVIVHGKVDFDAVEEIGRNIMSCIEACRTYTQQPGATVDGMYVAMIDKMLVRGAN